MPVVAQETAKKETRITARARVMKFFLNVCINAKICHNRQMKSTAVSRVNISIEKPAGGNMITRTYAVAKKRRF